MPADYWIDVMDLDLDAKAADGFKELCRVVATDDRFLSVEGYAVVWQNGQQLELLSGHIVARAYAAFRDYCNAQSSRHRIFRACRKFRLGLRHEAGSNVEEYLHSLKLAEPVRKEAFELYRGIALAFGYEMVWLNDSEEVCDRALPKACAKLARSLLHDR